jgi:hypothetical protein
MKRLPGVMALAVAVITAQLVVTPASATSLKYFKHFSRQSSQPLIPHFSSDHEPVVGPKLTWMGEFNPSKREHFTSVFDGLDADQNEKLSSLRDALRQSVFGDSGSLREYIGELSNDRFDGYRFARGADRFSFYFDDHEPKFQDWTNNKSLEGQTNVVPIPSAVWLMLSGLLAIAYRAKPGKSKTDSNGVAEGSVYVTADKKLHKY